MTLASPRGSKTRPTGAKVREAMFAILAQRVEGARVLDLFAGSGALGLEAISRGAASVVFVDNDANAVMIIRRNAVRVVPDGDRWRIMPMRALRALAHIARLVRHRVHRPAIRPRRAWTSCGS